MSPFSILNGLGVLYEGMGDSSRSRVAIGFPKNHETFLKMFKVSNLTLHLLNESKRLDC